jgi:hypothetical protein
VVELGFAGVAWLLCVLVFLAVLVMQKRRRCSSGGDLLQHEQRLGRPVWESGTSASSSSSGDDVVVHVNLEEDDLW